MPYSPSYHITLPPNLYTTSPPKKNSRFPCSFPFLDFCPRVPAKHPPFGSLGENTHVGSLQEFPGLEMVGSGGSPDIIERCAGGRWKVDEKPSTRMRSCWYLPRWWQLKYFFILTPNLGEMIQFDEHIFQMGWFKPPTSYPLVTNIEMAHPNIPMNILGKYIAIQMVGLSSQSC